jgi:hypothetical protein
MEAITTATKIITIDTNFGGKMGNETFIHVDLAPTKPVNEPIMLRVIVEVRTRDNSHPPVYCRLYDLARFPLHKCHRIYTMNSHHMDPNDFINYLYKKYRNLTPHTPLAAYFYHHILQPVEAGPTK